MTLALATPYGSDKSGLIFGYLFAPATGGRPIGGNTAVEWLAGDRRGQADGFVWLHFDLTNVASEKWLREHLSLSPAYFEAVHEGARATRIDYADGALIAVINEQNSRSLFLLTIFTVLALPINIIAGLFGMNVGGIPLTDHAGGFWIIVGVVAAFTLAALWIVLRRRRD